MISLRSLGFVLFGIGFLVASFTAVRQADSAGAEWQTVHWGWYANGFLTCLIGVVLIRMTGQSAEAQAERVKQGLQDCVASIARIDDWLSGVLRDRDSVDVYDVHRRIDDELLTDLEVFAESRETMASKFGLQPYADIMSRFALGERTINRAWSASADGYVDEVWSCIKVAHGEMSAAREKLTSLYDESDEA